jgi:hypothetical protein
VPLFLVTRPQAAECFETPSPADLALSDAARSGRTCDMNETSPIRVFERNDEWLIDYGSYAHGYYPSRDEAVHVATDAARAEHRTLVIEAVAPARRTASKH